MGDGFREGRYTSTRPSFTGELLLRPNPPTCRVQTRRGPVACVVLGRSGGEFHTPEQRPQWDGLQGFVRVKKVGRYLPAASVRGHLAGYLHTTYRSPDRAPLGSARLTLCIHLFTPAAGAIRLTDAYSSHTHTHGDIDLPSLQQAYGSGRS